MSDGTDEDEHDDVPADGEAESEPDAPAEDAETTDAGDDTGEAAADEPDGEAANAGEDGDADADADGAAAEDTDTAEADTDDGDADADAEESDEGEEDENEETAVDVTADGLHESLDDVAAALEDAATEADLDDVEADLDAVETKLEAANLPEPDEDDEDSEDPRAELEARVEELREGIEEQRGPYAEDVVADVESARSTLTDAEWTDTGEREAAETVETFLAAVGETLDGSVDAGDAFPESYADALDEVGAAVGDASLDADEDAAVIADLLDATDALAAGLEEAEVWDDLTVVEQLTAEGFYDRLESQNRKDFPPELGVVRIAEHENDPERILMALDYLESDFMQDNCVNALRRLGAPEAYDAMMALAQRRDRPAIEVLGKIGNDDACETLHDYIDGESNPPLQKTVLKALGEIGAEASVQPVADRLVAEDPEVRSQAARALGRIGDTRAVDPLADVLAEDDSDNVRAAAAWALYQIGTETALEAAAEYADDRSYIVQNEAEKAAAALDAAAPAA